METTTKSITDSVIDGLKKAVTELEEFRLQLALGKAEAADKYEEAKKNFNEIIADFKTKLNEGNAKAIELKGKLDELMVQLALGKASSKDSFNEQKKKISTAIREIEDFILRNPLGLKLQSKLKLELEKFQIKMEILHLRFALAKMDAKDVMESRKKEFVEKIEDLKHGFLKHEPELKENWEHFSKEMNEAYIHLKNAFVPS